MADRLQTNGRRGAERFWDGAVMPTQDDTDTVVLPTGPHAPDGSALALLRLPGVFTQDKLLSPPDVVRKSKEHGRPVTLAQLQQLHSHRILLPLYRVADSASEGRAIPVDEPLGLNPRGWVMQAAYDGRIRDCAVEGYSAAWPYEQPQPFVRYWHSGFFYSDWQLHDLAWALGELRAITQGWDHPGRHEQADLRRSRAMALAALSPRHLPSITGRVTTPGGVDAERQWSARFAIEEAERLTLAGFPADRLLHDAELLLGAAHDDPMIEWWPLMQHSGAIGWEKTHGRTAECIAARLAAEVLLRAHERLADIGSLDSLPDLSHAGWWSPLHDRIGGGSTLASLDQALDRLGLSPHPRVLLLVEGQTEHLHFTRLLRLFGLDRSDMVRVQNCRTSGVKPDLITRFVIAPRLAEKRSDVQMLHSHPTVLVIAMDPENSWTRPAQRENTRAKLKKAIREEVEAQLDGAGRIGDEDLDWLVSIHVWGRNTFELANFNDDELITAMDALAAHQNLPTDDAWRERARVELTAARDQPNDVKVALERLGLREDKIRLAELLWPVLLANVEDQLEWEEPTLPVLRVLKAVRQRVGLLLGGGYSLRPVDDDANEARRSP